MFLCACVFWEAWGEKYNVYFDHETMTRVLRMEELATAAKPMAK